MTFEHTITQLPKFCNLAPAKKESLKTNLRPRDHRLALIDECSSHLSSKKHLCEADEDLHRKLQLVKMYKTTIMRCLDSTDISTIQLILLRLRKHRRGAEWFKSRRNRKSVVWNCACQEWHYYTHDALTICLHKQDLIGDDTNRYVNREEGNLKESH